MVDRLLADVTMDVEVNPGMPCVEMQVTVTNVKDGRFRVEVIRLEATGREDPEYRTIKAGAYAWTISAAVSEARNRANAAGIHGMVFERALWAAEDEAENKLMEQQ